MEQEKVLLLEKGKRGLLRIVFSRTGIIIGLLAVQVLFLLAGIHWLASIFPYLWGASVVIAVVVVMSLIGSDDNPAFKLTWMLLLAALPIFGMLLYLYIKTDLGHRTMIRRFDEVCKQTQPLAIPLRQCPLRKPRRTCRVCPTTFSSWASPPTRIPRRNTSPWVSWPLKKC